MKKKTLATAAILTGALVGFASVTAIDIACKKRVPHKKKDDSVNPYIEKYLPWLKEQHFEDLEITSHDGLKLKAKLLKSDLDTDKVLIAVHGYRSYNLKEYAYYIKFYHDLGFHILMPDNRAHGESEGTYIGFGWLDRLDCIQWINKIKDYFNKDLQIVLHGISMGSATVLMASGEELPDDVKCIISDCGFTSVLDEFEHELKLAHIPPSLILPTATLLSKKRVGYSFKEASTINQVKKSKTPTLFIHGDQDDFVPTYMVYDLYNACAADKDLLIVEGAKHAESYLVNQELCERTIIEFMSQYVK
ncbi:alpha/beta hydrolase [Candidatus Stoquefichus massiliensis]|uniref:alpha/beta hydrolase n=1 Tax=Candidatus Stoquefichus massiliensis TaxID=1470350 RepID=UPI0004B0E913|nr:alpha/beta hydrolase [Candidatus Stoquefichus massiliensis]